MDDSFEIRCIDSVEILECRLSVLDLWQTGEKVASQFALDVGILGHEFEPLPSARPLGITHPGQRDPRRFEPRDEVWRQRAFSLNIYTERAPQSSRYPPSNHPSTPSPSSYPAYCPPCPRRPGRAPWHERVRLRAFPLGI